MGPAVEEDEAGREVLGLGEVGVRLLVLDEGLDGVGAAGGREAADREVVEGDVEAEAGIGGGEVEEGDEGVGVVLLENGCDEGAQGFVGEGNGVRVRVWGGGGGGGKETAMEAEEASGREHFDRFLWFFRWGCGFRARQNIREVLKGHTFFTSWPT